MQVISSSPRETPPPTPRLRPIPLPFISSPAIPPLIPSTFRIYLADTSATVPHDDHRLLECILFDDSDTLVVVGVDGRILWREPSHASQGSECSNNAFMFIRTWYPRVPEGQYQLFIHYEEDTAEWLFFLSHDEVPQL